MLTVGLTGGVAAGKSLVSQGLTERGVAVVDTDVLARAVVAPGTDGLAAVIAAFGETFRQADGSLDRAALRHLIFADPAAREQLESILHPRIRALMDEQVRAYGQAGERLVVTVIPLLVETGQQAQCDRVLVVDAPVEVQIERLCRRDGLAVADARRMLAGQAGRWQRLQHAHEVIANGDRIAPAVALDCQIDAIVRKYHCLIGEAIAPH